MDDLNIRIFTWSRLSTRTHCCYPFDVKFSFAEASQEPRTKNPPLLQAASYGGSEHSNIHMKKTIYADTLLLSVRCKVFVCRSKCFLCLLLLFYLRRVYTWGSMSLCSVFTFTNVFKEWWLLCIMTFVMTSWYNGFVYPLYLINCVGDPSGSINFISRPFHVRYILETVMHLKKCTPLVWWCIL
jgi:hypothetical protein